MTPSNQAPTEITPGKRSRWPLLLLAMALGSAGFFYHLSRQSEVAPEASIPDDQEESSPVKESPFAGKTYTVLGMVAVPGKRPFPLNGCIDLSESIAMVGGFTDLANPESVILTRNGKEMKIDLSGEKSGNTEVNLIPGDIVMVSAK